jgi:hypothetical protein
MGQTDYMLDLLEQTEYATGADASHWKGEWNPANVDMEMFQAVMDFMVIRAGYGAGDGTIHQDKKFESRYATLLKFPHILRAPYWYFSSQSSWQSQYAFFVKQLEGKVFDFIVLDFEKYYNKRTAAFANGAVYFMEALKHNFPGKRIFFYANKWDYKDWMKPFSDGADSFPYWIAQYPWKNWIANFTDWFKKWWHDLFVSGTRRPGMPNWLPQDHWELWQVIDASGIGQELGFDSDELDFNVSRRKKEDFIEWIGVPERWGVEEPTPPPAQGYSKEDLEKARADGRMIGLAEALDYLAEMVEEETG